MILRSQSKRFYGLFALFTLFTAYIAWQINPDFELVDTLSFSSSLSKTIPTQWTLVDPTIKKESIQVAKQSVSNYVAHETGWIIAKGIGGIEQWSFFAAEATSGFSDTFAYDDDSVYFLARNATLYSFHPTTGSLRWIHKLADKAASDIFIRDRNLFITVARGETSIVVNIDGNTGNLVWKSPPLAISPLQIALRFHLDKILVIGTSEHVIPLNISDGSLQ